MKKIIITSISMLLVLSLVAGCGKKDKDNNTNNEETTNKEQTVVEDQIFEGLESVNVGASDGAVKTVVINNTGYKYAGSKFSMKIMDASGNVLVEVTDEVKGSMETGTTKEISTKVNADLSKAASIEYSIVR